MRVERVGRGSGVTKLARWVRHRRAVMGCVILLAAVALWLGGGRDAVARRAAVRKLRPLYETVPPFPNAVRLGDLVEAERGDGRPTGAFLLTVRYRLPKTATAAAVLAHIRRNLPATWVEATDKTCENMMLKVPPPPPATLPDGDTVPPPSLPSAFVLLAKQTEITVERTGDRGVGLTFELVRRGPERLLHIHSPTPSCGSIDNTSSAVFDAP
jgi:hypothetical protein